MMIRSTPPASAHLAERPVPAPAPMIGRPASTCARSRASASSRVISASRIISSSRSAIASANASSFTSRSSSCTSTFGAERLAQPLEQRRVGLGVVERLALGRDHRDAAQRHEERRRPGRAGQLAPDPAAELAALVRRRPHQRDRRVVDVEVAVGEALGHALARPEVDHVERAERDDLRQAELARRLEPSRIRGQHAADELVGELRRRHVERAGDEAAARMSSSIDSPPVPVWWKTSTS